MCLSLCLITKIASLILMKFDIECVHQKVSEFNTFASISDHGQIKLF